MTASGYRLYNGLIKPLRQMDRDQGNLLLQRFLEGPQAQFERIEALVQTLKDQIKPDQTRADLLPYLLAIVGFTTELRSITDRLTEEQLRRLVYMAVPLWKERHTERGLINAIRLLTGRPAFYTSWFGYRNLLGEAMMGEDQLATGGDNWIIGGDITVYDEYWSNIRVMDDGTLDELLLIDVVRLMRPMSERIEVVLLDFLDKFEGELDRWTTVTGTNPAIVDGVMEIPTGTFVEPIIPILPTAADHEDYALVAKFRLDAANTVFKTRWRISGTTYYDLQITTTDPQILFSRVTAGVPTTLYSATHPSVSIVEDVWYKLRITTTNVGTNRHIQIYIDANLIVPTSGSHYIDSVGVAHQTGPYRFGTFTGPASIDNVESWQQPGRFATIELSTPDEPGGEATMTANFIQ